MSERITFDELKILAPEVHLSLNKDTGIVVADFKINGIAFSGQYSSCIEGIYGFGVSDETVHALFKLLAGMPPETTND